MTESTEEVPQSRCLRCCSCICKVFVFYILASCVIGYILLTPKNPVFKAAYENNKNYVLTYIENGGDVNSRDSHNNTALFWAARAGNIDIINLLCKNGIDVNAKNDISATALHTSLFSNNTKVISSLISHGSDVNSQDEDGNTPLHIACQFRFVQSVEALLLNHADPNIQNNDGDTPLHLVGEECFNSEECKKIVDIMKEHHADMKIKNRKGVPAIDVILTSDTINQLKEFSKNQKEREHQEL